MSSDKEALLLDINFRVSPRYIAIEGLDGVGKSSFLGELETVLVRSRECEDGVFDILSYKEHATDIFKRLVKEHPDDPAQVNELFIEKLIEMRLDNNRIFVSPFCYSTVGNALVFVDRSWLSTVAYQGLEARSYLALANQKACELSPELPLTMPGLFLVLQDVKGEDAVIQRCEERNAEADGLESWDSQVVRERQARFASAIHYCQETNGRNGYAKVITIDFSLPLTPENDLVHQCAIRLKDALLNGKSPAESLLTLPDQAYTFQKPFEDRDD